MYFIFKLDRKGHIATVQRKEATKTSGLRFEWRLTRALVIRRTSTDSANFNGVFCIPWPFEWRLMRSMAIQIIFDMVTEYFNDIYDHLLFEWLLMQPLTIPHRRVGRRLKLSFGYYKKGLRPNTTRITYFIVTSYLNDVFGHSNI